MCVHCIDTCMSHLKTLWILLRCLMFLLLYLFMCMVGVFVLRPLWIWLLIFLLISHILNPDQMSVSDCLKSNFIAGWKYQTVVWCPFIVYFPSILPCFFVQVFYFAPFSKVCCLTNLVYQLVTHIWYRQVVFKVVLLS